MSVSKKVGDVEFQPIKQYHDDLVQTHGLRHATAEAKFTMECVERWELVAAMPDGEDSSGRQKLRVMTTDELVSKACQVTAGVFAEMERRGWIVDAPTLAELDDMRKTDDESN